jgi:hydroxymethylpyrimidine pyrophosphatase-like HAD family hydrolase
MLVPPVMSSVTEATGSSVLCEELKFYQSYQWCLNPYLTVSQAIRHLDEEIEKLGSIPDGWQAGEVATNIFLLSGGLLNCIDEYLLGLRLRLPKRLATTVVARGASRVVETIANRPWSQRQLRRRREEWLSSLNDFLSLMIQERPSASLAESARRLVVLLRGPLPAALQAQRLGIPIPFRRLDLTQRDCLSLGELFVRRFPDRAQPLLLLGLRTAGSYLAPLLKAFFEVGGYASVELLTIEPNKGPSRWEKKELERFATRGFWALIVDDAPHTSDSLLAALNFVHRAGFRRTNIKFLVPTHPVRPSWFKPLPEATVITLQPDRWHKRQLLNPRVAELRLTEYFRAQNFARVSVTGSRRTDEFIHCLEGNASDMRGVRLKQIFEVELETSEGEKHTKHVLAKSVGWGWLGYHAFIIGHRLSELVPPMLGLRDGILYMEWIPQSATASGLDRNQVIEVSARYVAARVRRLNLSGSVAGMDLNKYDNGIRMLAQALSRAYGRFPATNLVRPQLGKLLRNRPCPFPTLIDGNMHLSEWISGQDGPLKTDYEHHGMGRSVLNVIDPAFDLADAILNLALSPQEERRLIQQYIEQSGDTSVEHRLYMHKLLAGLWAMSQSQDHLFDPPRGGNAQRSCHQRFMNAWNFLVVHTARHCGTLCHAPTNLDWHAPLVVLDIDGVLDRRLFGFPSTTISGIKALSLLSTHGFSVALNSARSVGELKDYCEAYGLAGGVAESGSYLWDGVGRRERVLISPEARHQLAELRANLLRIPGVFLDERHRYSIKAFTYRTKPHGLMHTLIGSAHVSAIGDGAMVPISTHIVHQLLEDLRLDQLAFRHTGLDTTIVAKEVDKGTGLVALRDWVLTQDAETIAVGDDVPDLAMFGVATRCFAPANITCRNQARLHGCTIVPNRDQRGLLDIVHKIIHPDGGDCEVCSRVKSAALSRNDLLLAALQAGDQNWSTNLRRALRSQAAYKFFFQ